MMKLECSKCSKSLAPWHYSQLEKAVKRWAKAAKACDFSAEDTDFSKDEELWDAGRKLHFIVTQLYPEFGIEPIAANINHPTGQREG